MYLVNNPVLQRELLNNLRLKRTFVLLLAYVSLFGGLVYLAWPENQHFNIINPEASRRLVALFFVGQFVLTSLMAPSFAAGAITGEKERHTYEMLLASPLTPGAIILGKLLASICHLVLLIIASLPIIVLCLPLGGTSIYDVLALYAALLWAMITYGLLSLAASSYFTRTFAALVVSYLLVLPLAALGVGFWFLFSESGSQARLVLLGTVLPVVGGIVWLPLIRLLRNRLLYPPDVGSEGKEVVDEEQELQQAVGLVFERGQFPDSLFAPAKRTDLLADGANPVFDKELRSEIFSQGTLMLRVVIQASMLLAIFAMWLFIYGWPDRVAWYTSYVIVFNLLVGPVFSAGSVTSERERETLDLLLTTTLSPWMILWPKLVSGLRVSSVLTLFLVWPLLLSCLMVTHYWGNLGSMLLYLVIILTVCVTTANVALFCSVLFRKTSVSLMTSYLVLLLLFTGPIAANVFTDTFLPGTRLDQAVQSLAAISPFGATFAVPLTFSSLDLASRAGSWDTLEAYFAIWFLGNAALGAVMVWLFHARWRVAQ